MVPEVRIVVRFVHPSNAWSPTVTPSNDSSVMPVHPSNALSPIVVNALGTDVILRQFLNAASPTDIDPLPVTIEDTLLLLNMDAGIEVTSFERVRRHPLSEPAPLNALFADVRLPIMVTFMSFHDQD